MKITSCPGAPVALRHAASRQADWHYGLKKHKIFNIRDPVGYSQSVPTLQKPSSHS